MSESELGVVWPPPHAECWSCPSEDDCGCTPTEDDEFVAGQRAAHERHGTTVEVVFPADAPFEAVEGAVDTLTDFVFGLDRDGWDPFVSASRSGRSTLDVAEAAEQGAREALDAMVAVLLADATHPDHARQTDAFQRAALYVANRAERVAAQRRQILAAKETSGE